MKKLLIVLACSGMLFSCSDDPSTAGPSEFEGNVVEYFPIPSTEEWVVQEWDEIFGVEYDTVRVEGKVPVEHEGETIEMYELSHTVAALEVKHYFDTEGMHAYFPDQGSILFLPATLSQGVEWVTYLPPLINWSLKVTHTYNSLEITTHQGWIRNFSNIARVYNDMGDGEYSVSYFALGIGMVYQEQYNNSILVNSSTMMSRNGNDVGWVIP